MHRQPYKFCVIADPHYFSSTLGKGGEAYELRSGSDQKFLAETNGILRAAFAELAQSDVQAVLIAGDLTNNGEVVSHEELRSLLCELQRTKEVYVITATHDWCSDGLPRRYQGAEVLFDAPVLKTDELRDFYAEFGPNQAIAEYKTQIGTSSYVVALNEKLWLLALNDDKNENGKAGYAPEHLAWILEQLRAAREQDVMVVGMQHHLLLPHTLPAVTRGQSVQDRDALAEAFADAGLGHLFVGHSHFQNVKRYVSPGGNTLYQCNVASISGYPAPLVFCSVDAETHTLHLRTECLQQFSWQGASYDQEAFRSHATQMITRILDGALSGNKVEYSKRMGALGVKENTARKLYLPLRFFARYLRRKTLKSLARTANRLTFGRAIPHRKDIIFPETLMLSMVLDLMLRMLDGGQEALGTEDTYYQAVMALVRVPARLLKKNTLFRQLPAAAHQLLTGGEISAYAAEL